MMKYFIVLFSLISFSSFGQEKTGMHCQLIKKPFILKNGKATDREEFYLRCSVADYFIKICESSVAAEELEKLVGKGLDAEIEIVNGSWDICEDDPEQMQSRIGEYAIIKKMNRD